MTQDIHAPDGPGASPRRGLDRRTVLRGATLGAAAPLIPAASAAAATATAGRDRGGERAARSVSFRWLGTAGWRIDVGGRTVLFDPYLTRFRTGLFDDGLDPKTELTTDPTVVD